MRMTRAIEHRLTVMVGAALLAFGSVSQAADSFEVKAYPVREVQRAASEKMAVQFDGKLEEAQWQSAPIATDFTGHDRPDPMEVQTGFRLLHDNEYLYIGVVCNEPETAKLKPIPRGWDDPAIWNDDLVELFIDPTHSHSEYVHIVVTAAGSVYDEQITDAAWNSKVVVKNALDRTCWTIEAALPWKEIGVKPTTGMVLGLNVCRSRRAGGATVWSNWSQTMGGFHDPLRFGHLVLSPGQGTIAQLEPELRKGLRTGPLTVAGTPSTLAPVRVELLRENIQDCQKMLDTLAAFPKGKGSGWSSFTEADLVARLAALRARVDALPAADAQESRRIATSLNQLRADIAQAVAAAELADLLERI